MRVPLVYKEGPIFGCDIGSQAVKIVELSGKSGHPKVVGYGYGEFDPKLVVQGIVADPEELAKTIKQLLTKPQVGRIKADRAVLSVPVSRIFVRTLHLPVMDAKDLEQAVKLEAEQYIPVPINDLYLDYHKIKEHPGGKEPGLEIEMVAAPRAIVDSYMKLFDTLGIFVEAVEISLTAILRAMASLAGTASMLIDFGSESADLVISEETIKLSAAIPVGGNTLTKALRTALGVKPAEAQEIKEKFGIAPSGLQTEILTALKPSLDVLVAEVKKALKYFRERNVSHGEVTKIVLTGGSSLMPGMVEYLSKAIGIDMSVGNSWQRLDMRRLPQPGKNQQAMYTTAIGLAMLGTKS